MCPALPLQCGTPEFTAPEITTGREYDGPSVDMWSMGVILYEALTGSLPFKGASTAALFKAIQRCGGGAEGSWGGPGSGALAGQGCAGQGVRHAAHRNAIEVGQLAVQ